MKKITRDLTNEAGFDFEDLLIDIKYYKREHRKGDTFFVNAIIEINEAYFPKIPRFLDGLYLTNDFIISDEYGYEYRQIYELLPVEWVTETITIEKQKLKYIHITN